MSTLELFAVYGTLRAGEHNAGIWRGVADLLASGTVDGYALAVNHPQAGYPFAMPTPHSRIVVDVIATDDPTLRDRLDRLEGYPRLYNRVMVAVNLRAPGVGVVAREAWLYTPAADTARRVREALEDGAGAYVPDGDWVAWLDNRWVDSDRGCEVR